MSNHPTIAALKAELKQQRRDIKNYHACYHGDCPHDKQESCMDALVDHAHEAATERLMGLVSKATEVIELCDKWFQEIYPKDIFIGGPNADEGVNRVVEMREKAREFLSTLADASGEINKDGK